MSEEIRWEVRTDSGGEFWFTELDGIVCDCSGIAKYLLYRPVEHVFRWLANNFSGCYIKQVKPKGEGVEQ